MGRRDTENVKKRKSYYGFARNYPGKLGSSKYVIGESRAVKRRESVRRITIAVLVILIFVFSFIVTSVCLEVSERKPRNAETTEATTQITTDKVTDKK